MCPSLTQLQRRLKDRANAHCGACLPLNSRAAKRGHRRRRRRRRCRLARSDPGVIRPALLKREHGLRQCDGVFVVPGVVHALLRGEPRGEQDGEDEEAVERHHDPTEDVAVALPRSVHLDQQRQEVAQEDYDAPLRSIDSNGGQKR